MSTKLSSDVMQLVAQELASGRYNSEEEVLTEAVQLLNQRNALREHIAAGTRQLAAGEYTEYDPQSLRRRLDDLKSGIASNAERDI
jgi:putative addiction module CopG family antidote